MLGFVVKLHHPRMNRKPPLPKPDQKDLFESLCVELFRRIWDDEYAQLRGVSGQAQDGIDILGKARSGTERVAAQCKVRSKGKLSFNDIVADLEKADNFHPQLHRIIFATTAGRDATLQGRVFALSEERLACGKFPVVVMAWEDLCEQLHKYPEIAKCFYPDYFPIPSLGANNSGTDQGTDSPVGQVKFLHLWPGQIPPGRTVRIVVHVPAAGLVSPA